MDFRCVTSGLLDSKADLAVLCVLGDPSRDDAFKKIDSALDGVLRDIAKERGFKGKSGQSISARIPGGASPKYVAVYALGDSASFEPTALRTIGSRAATLGQQLGSKSVVFGLPELSPPERARAVHFVVQGAVLGTYKFDKYLTKNPRKNSLKRFLIAPVVAGKKPPAAHMRSLRAAMSRGQIISAAVCKARDLVNEPAGHMTPSQMATEARAIARKHGLKIKVLSRKECERLGMNMFLAVGRGSAKEPKFIHMTYTPKDKTPKSKIALIGKGVMFDSGGYSLKPSAAMEDMKVDMAGGAAVISSMAAIAELGSDHEVHAITACCENLVSGDAYKLGDVLKSMDGTTVEINNTDAEGRLTLGDAITYARTKIKPDEIFDFATLTGACMVALGPYTAGVMSDSEKTVTRWLEAADRAGEDMWRLPLNKRLKEQLKSNIADMRNTGERYGGAITAGLFLQNFAKDSTWVHVDIAGPSSTSKRKNPSVPRGGTGFAVASIVEYVAKS